MTGREPYSYPSNGRLAVRSFRSPSSLRGGPRVQERSGAHQVIRNDAETDPAGHAVCVSIETSSQTMPSFDHTDASFAADTPALSAPEPALPLVDAPSWCFPPRPGQDDPSHPAGDRRLFVLRRRESPIAGRELRRTVEDRDVAIQRRRPQGRVGRTTVVHVVRGDNLVLRGCSSRRHSRQRCAPARASWVFGRFVRRLGSEFRSLRPSASLALRNLDTACEWLRGAIRH
jgi:hypothetical protein